MYGQIALHDIDDMFSELRSREGWQDLIKEELRKLFTVNVKGGIDQGVIQERHRQIVTYYRLLQSAGYARKILELRDAYKLKGNFDMETRISNSVSVKYMQMHIR